MTQNFLFYAVDRYREDGIDRCAGQRGTKADLQHQPDTTACLEAWYTWARILQTNLEGGNLQGSLHKEVLDIGQKEVNMTWWQPPLSLDSWMPVQSWSMILQYKQTLTQERN
ncbi:hypothetical protein IGI04_019264 [Brassica rapa subsp. trilocularis]|uniref:Uncharacterized protein n=1 Tax=Brassica rapa subsp. trilocularis TaxID=1813537 RepID=A0ABQ7MHQ7_BRACM|nr:hypothetical protein IGI04_019264 [Brassica rapa subsp. trilocularis]